MTKTNIQVICSSCDRTFEFVGSVIDDQIYNKEEFEAGTVKLWVKSCNKHKNYKEVSA